MLLKKQGVTLDQLFSRIEQGEVKDLNLIVKARNGALEMR